MPAKLLFGLIAVAIIISVAMIVAYLYFRDTAYFRHKERMHELEDDDE